MAESSKKKSRSELIRETLGSYLKQRNYVPCEKYRKSDFALTQNKKQFIFNKMIENDLTKVNSFLYSNVMCLTNNPATVDQQFNKFVEFVESHKVESVRNELSILFGPLLSHLYIELLKGRDWKPAMDFLNKYAHLVATVENYTAPLPNKVNGCSVAGKLDDDPLVPAATTQIVFSSESTGSVVRDHFKNLVQTLSTCLKCETLETIDSIVLLRSSKYQIDFHLESLIALKEHLSKQGHLIILNVFHNWFDFEIVDLKDNEPVNNEYRNLNVCKEEKMEIDNNLENGVDSIEGKSNKSSPEKKISNSYLRRLRHSAVKLQKAESPARNFVIADQGRILTTAAIDNLQCHLVAGFNNSLVKMWQLNQNTCPGKNLYRKQCNRHCEWESTNTEIEENEHDEIENDIKSTRHFITGKRIECDEINEFDDTGGIALHGHSRGVTDVVFSKRHPILLTTSKDSTMRLWKSSTYQCAAIYRGHNYPIWCCSESPLGQYVATGSKDFTARLWTLEREFPVLTYVGHTQDVDTIAFHPNGSYLATGSTDLSVRLWSVTSGRLFRVFTDCKFPIRKVAFSPDGKYLAAGGDETKVRIFDLAAGSQITELKEHTSQITDITWNNSGKILASSCSDGTIRLWDVAKLGTSDGRSSSNKLIWCANNGNRIAKIFFNSLDMISTISSSCN